MVLTLLQIERKVREYTAIIHAPEEFIPTFGHSKNSGLPHVEIGRNNYHLIVVEDGEELSRKSSSDPDELLFMILQTITLSMACDRVFEDTNFPSLRSRLFQAQKNIISKIHLSYMQKIKTDQDQIQSEFSLNG